MGTRGTTATGKETVVTGTIGPAGIHEMTGPSPEAAGVITVEATPLLGTATMGRQARNLARVPDEIVDIRAADPIRTADRLQVEAQEVEAQVAQEDRMVVRRERRIVDT